MSLPPDFLDDLRARTSLFSVVGRRVKLVRAGREMKGPCPFHNEKTPSFYVNEDKGFYHCFGCGAHGDAIRFVMEQDGLAFMEAVKALAAEAGLAVPEGRPRDPEQERRASLHELLAAAADWYRAQLASAAGADARAYLAKRGVRPSDAAAFGLGYAPDSRDALSKAMAAKFPAVEPAQLLESGLVGETESAPGAAARRYDRMRGRLIFPIHDARGRAVGFGGRILGAASAPAPTKGHEPKYLNSPEGPVFHKGRLLYNLHRAAPAARKAGRLLVVEGYMDVVGLAGAGVAEAVAPLGTALTEDQMAACWRLVPEPVLAFDGDSAGARAALKAALRALPLLGPGRSLAFAVLPKGQDPDDLARNGGQAAIEVLLATARPLERFLFEAEAAQSPLDTPERRAAFRQRLRALAGEIPDPDVRRDYLETWRARADDLLRPVRPPAPQPAGRGGSRFQPPIPGARPETRAADHVPNEITCGMLLKALGPEDAERHVEALADLPVTTPTLMLARDHLVGGRPAGGLLAGYRALSLPDPATEPARRSTRIATALASVAESHHMGTKDRQPQGPAGDDAWEEALERNRAAAIAHQARIRMRAALNDDQGEA